MGKNPNTFAKRQREMEKKRKAEDKRKKRLDRKENPLSDEELAAQYVDPRDDFDDDVNDETAKS